MNKQPEKTVGCSGNVVWVLLAAIVLSALLGAGSIRADEPQPYIITLPLVYNNYEADPMCWIMDR